MALSGLGGDLSVRYALDIDSYDRYCGYSSVFISVDVLSVAKSFEALFSSPELRRKMGDSGRSRARSIYDWAAVFSMYEDLWDELFKIRASHRSKQTRAHSDSRWPARSDPYKIFAAYPSRQLTLNTKLSIVDQSVEEAITRLKYYRDLVIISYLEPVTASLNALTLLLRKIGSNSDGVLIAEALKVIPHARRAINFRSLVFLCMMNLLKAK